MDMLHGDAFKSPDLKVLEGLQPGSPEAKAAFQKVVQSADHNHDGKPDQWAGKGMDPGEGGRFAYMFDQALLNGQTPAEAQAATAAHGVRVYGADGMRAMAAKANPSSGNGSATTGGTGR